MRVASARGLAVSLALACASTLCLAQAGCSSCGAKRDPMAKLDGLEQALVAGDDAALAKTLAEYPKCEMPPLERALDGLSPSKGCLPDIATALGSRKGYAPKPPDQSANAAAAIVLARDKRGDVLGESDVWLGMLRGGEGPGPSSLRIATATRMADVAPKVGREIDDEAAAAELAKAIASAIPGACPTYHHIGDTPASKLPAALEPDHAACVQHDLSRRDGPGPGYGFGTFRAAEGAMSLWRATEAALRLGAKVSPPKVRAIVEQKLAIIEPRTLANKMKKVQSQRDIGIINFMGAAHADAGIILWKQDGGAEGGAPDAGPTDARLRGKP